MKKIFSLFISFILLFNIVSFAQVKDEASLMEDKDDLAYRIYPGDVLEINVYGSNMHHPGVQVRVSSDGIISFPLIGRVKVAGLTAVEASELIDKKLLDGYLTDPQVSVFVHERTRSAEVRTFAISGAVNRPGVYPVKLGLTLQDAVSLAGGTSDERANIHEIELIRKEEDGEREFILDLEQDSDFKIRVQDRIIVGIYGTYLIYGQVKKPGKYFISEDLTVANAILNAGGFTDIASRNAIKIIRQGESGGKETIKIPAAHIFRTGNIGKDVKVEDGDIIVVPESWF